LNQPPGEPDDPLTASGPVRSPRYREAVTETDGAAPPPAVIERFGADPEPVRRLAGGQGGSWRAGDIVLKRAESASDASWLGPILSSLPADGRFRLGYPVASRDAGWVVDGWEATTWQAGAHEPRRWHDALRVSMALHSALRGHVLCRPEVLDLRTDPWAIGDRVAWDGLDDGELGPAGAAVVDTLERFIHRPWPGPPAQLIHGDLGLGNILFADDIGLPPAVIDFSPYWRPAPFASAVLVADAVAWEDAPLALARAFLTETPGGPDLIARAVVYRVVAAAHHFGADDDRIAAEVDHYSPLVDIVAK
jgi:uncharacterized protein (TIGR02569 family)